MEKLVLIGIDRDGTIIKDKDFLGKNSNWKEEVELCPDVIEGIKLWKKHPLIKLAVISNQAGVAWGYFIPMDVILQNNYINNLLNGGCAGIDIDNWYFCPYVDSAYARERRLLGNEYITDNPGQLRFRKPGIGMLEQAASDFGMSLEDFEVYVIGNQKSDVETGLNANGKGILISNGQNQKHQSEVKEMMLNPIYKGDIFITNSFLGAAHLIINNIACHQST